MKKDRLLASPNTSTEKRLKFKPVGILSRENLCTLYNLYNDPAARFAKGKVHFKHIQPVSKTY